ncbi:MAG: sigma-70 family RNA polymerase sigma factor [Candidatus Zipacnadales bacterium]
MSNAQPAALIERARAGDCEAFEQLVEPHIGRIYNYIARMVGNPADAEDLTQEAILRAHRAIGAFRGGATFQTWLYRIATNIAVDALRRRGRQDAKVSSLDDPVRLEENLLEREVAATQRDPHQLVETAELCAEVNRAINQLSPKLRAVIVLFDLQGLSYKEIAKTLRLPLGTIKSRLFNARARLRDLLQPYIKAEP